MKNTMKALKAAADKVEELDNKMSEDKHFKQLLLNLMFVKRKFGVKYQDILDVLEQRYAVN